MTYKSIKIAVVLGLIGAPTMAEDMIACDDDGLNKVIEQIEEASSETKAEAIEQLQMAKDKMAGGDADGFSLHLTNASKAASGA